MNTKFSEVERKAIMAQARAHLRWQPETQQRNGANRLVCKTIDNARAPMLAPKPDVPVPDDEYIFEAVGQVIASERRDFQRALDKRDREIEALRREIKMLRDEVGLERGLAALKAEVDQARQQAPSFKAELAGLRKEVEKQQKTIVRLRGQASQLEFGQRQLASELTKSRHEISVTAVTVSSIGAQTRTALEALREAGVDFIEEWSPSGPAS